jgi:hypothetical protein
MLIRIIFPSTIDTNSNNERQRTIRINGEWKIILFFLVTPGSQGINTIIFFMYSRFLDCQVVQ